VFEGGNQPRLEVLQASLRQYDSVAQNSKYQSLVGREEFRSTHELLRDYIREQSESVAPHLALPPPPPKR
jgi:hypothetical protein